MTEPKILLDADFDPRVKSYWIWGPVLFFTVLVVTIPIAILYGIIAFFFTGRYLASLHCTLTDRSLDIKKGILNQTESTVPLEKITDLQLFQGPIMRIFGVHGFKVETAGQAAGPGAALVNLIGIVDTKGFRKAVLDQRDRLRSGFAGASPGTGASSSDATLADPRAAELLTEIRDSLQRLERAVVSGSDQATPK